MKPYNFYSNKKSKQANGLIKTLFCLVLFCMLLMPAMINTTSAMIVSGPTITQNSYADYVPGGLVYMTCMINDLDGLSAFGVTIELPVGWSYELQSMSGPDLPYNDKPVENGVEFFWTKVPDKNSIEFHYMLRSSSEISGDQTIKANILYRINDGSQDVLPAEPVTVNQTTVNGFHNLSEFIDDKTCTVNNTIFYFGDLTALGVRLSIPEKTLFSESEKPAYQIKHLNESTIELFWNTPPPSPVTFSYLLTRDGATDENAVIESKLFYRVEDGLEDEKIIEPASLAFPPGDQFKIHASTSDDNGGQIYPEGIVEISIGQSITFTQTTADGYRFKGWLVDGTIDNNFPFTQYRFDNVMDDHFIKAMFDRIEYQINIDKGKNGTITSTTGDNKVYHGEDIGFIINPNEGYEIDNVLKNNEIYDLHGDNIVEFKNVINNQQSLAVTFKLKQYEINIIVGNNGQCKTQDNHNFVNHGEDKTFVIIPDEGFVVDEVKVNDNVVELTDNTYTFRHVVQDDNKLEVSFVQIENFVITTHVEGDGKISPQGNITIEHGQEITFKFIPGADSIIKDVKLDGISYGPIDNYRLYVSDNHTITAIFESKKQFTITASSEEGGTVYPSEVTVFQGDRQTFTITPSNGYHIKEVFVDEQPKGDILSYTFWDIKENHTISAVFEKDDYSYSIKISHSANGSVEPSGDVTVNQGDSLLIKTFPVYGYAVEDVIIDEESKGPLSKILLDNVRTEHDVYIQFKLIADNPAASFTVYPTSGLSPLKVKFNNLSEGYIQSWLWHFGDGEKSATKNPVHTYSNPGSYTVTLTASGPGGIGSKTIASCIQVEKIEDVIVSFIAKNTRGLAPLDVQFLNLTRDNVTSWLWDFGDGTTSTEENPNHVYTKTGNYSVTLTADNIYTSQKNDYVQISGRSIQGRVLAGDVNGDEPGNGLAGYIVEAHIRLNAILKPLFITNTLTDENGNYTLVELPLTDRLIISAWPPYDDNQYLGEYYQNKLSSFTANKLSTQNSSLTGIDFVLKKTLSLGIHGQVINNNVGQPDIEVNAFSESTFSYQTTLTDNEGFYTFTNLMDASDYRIYIWSESHQSELYYHLPKLEDVGIDLPSFSVLTWELARTVTPDDPMVHNINIIIETEETTIGTIEGTVRLKEGGKAVEGLRINAWSDYLKVGNDAITNASGKYVIKGLLIPDTENSHDGYIVEIDSSNDLYPYQAYNQVDDRSRAQKVLPGSDNINFFLKTGNTIFGNVSDSEGNPIPGVNIQTWSLSQKTNNSATTDAYGMYSLPNLPPASDYVIAAFSDKYPVQYFFHKEKKINADHVDITEGNVYNIDFQLDEGAVIEGNISVQYQTGSTEPAGAGIFVNVWSNTNGFLHTEKTDESGHYRFVGLDTNTLDYIIYIWEKGYLRSYYNANTTVYKWSDATYVQPDPSMSTIQRNLVLFSGYEITGKITYDNVPIANVKIEAWDEATETFVDDVSVGNVSKGYNYQLTGLVGDTTYEIRIYHDKFIDDTKMAAISNSDITVDFYLQPYALSISGTISGLDQGDNLLVKATQKNTTNMKMILVNGTGNKVDYMIPGLEKSKKYIVDIVPTPKYPYIAYYDQTTVQKANLVNLEYTNATKININLFTETVSIAGRIQFPASAIKDDAVTIYANSDRLKAENQTTVFFKNNLDVDYEITGLRPSDDYVVSLGSNLYKKQIYNQAISVDQATHVDTTDTIPDTDINFVLTMGTCIQGTVYAENGKGKPNVRVEAWSDKLQSLGYATTLSDGSYRIGGLEKADDYVVYISYDNTIFYYNTSEIVSNMNHATFVSTTQLNPTDIDFKIIITESISGTVRNSDNRSLENVMVSATSESTGAGNGCKTDKKGLYVITNLPPGKDYHISVIPQSDTNYIAQIKSNVKTGTTNNDFILKRGYTLKGIIKSWKNEPVPKVEIEISSKDAQQPLKDTTDDNGYYEINGIAERKGYNVFITAPTGSALVDFFEKGLLINQDTEKDFILAPASQIDGHVTIYDSSGLSGQIPASNVMITLFSPELGYWKTVHTDSEGYYIFENIPDAFDYIIKSISDNYVDHVETDRSSGETINFSLKPGNIIEGIVLNGQTGAGMNNARIEIYCKSDQPIKNTRADENGYFKAGSLDTTVNGETVQEYVVIARYRGFPEAQAIWKVDQADMLLLKMSKGEENILTGNVRDSKDIAPPEDVSVFVYLYNYQSRGGLIQAIKCESDGSFKFEGLNTTRQYQLKIITKKSMLQSPKCWVGINGTASAKRSGAAIIKTQDGQILFKFNESWTGE